MNKFGITKIKNYLLQARIVGLVLIIMFKSKLILFFFVCGFAFKINSQSPVLYPNFPKLLDSAYNAPSTYSSKLIITDLEKDGQKEIVTAVNKTTTSMLLVIKSDGSNYPGFPIVYPALIQNLASGDVNNDGSIDIAIRFENSIDVINRFGISLSGFPVSLNSVFWSSRFVSLYDFDNDGNLEIITNRFNEINVFNYNGQIRTGWPRYTPGEIWYNPATGDFDKDGFAEIIFSSFKVNPTDSGVINILKHDGTNFSNNWPLYLDSGYVIEGGSPTLFIDKNYPDSTFFCISASRVIVPPLTVLNRLTKYRSNGTIINTGYQVTIGSLGPVVGGDVDFDGVLEFASGSQYEFYTTLYDNNLRVQNNWPQTGGGSFYGSWVFLGKVSSGNSLSIISNTQDGGNGFYGRIFTYRPNGTLLNWSPLRPYGLVYGMAFTDLNSDGSAELVITSWSGINPGTLSLHIFSFPGIPFTNANYPWAQKNHDRYSTNQYGFVPPDEPIGILPISNTIPKEFSLSQNYPNPFNPSTKIKFSITLNKGLQPLVQLKVYDVLGREVATLVNEQLKPRTYETEFDGSNFASGIYFYTLQTEGFIDSKKMILVK